MEITTWQIVARSVPGIPLGLETPEPGGRAGRGHLWLTQLDFGWYEPRSATAPRGAQ